MILSENLKSYRQDHSVSNKITYADVTLSQPVSMGTDHNLYPVDKSTGTPLRISVTPSKEWNWVKKVDWHGVLCGLSQYGIQSVDTLLLCGYSHTKVWLSENPGKFVVVVLWLSTRRVLDRKCTWNTPTPPETHILPDLDNTWTWSRSSRSTPVEFPTFPRTLVSHTSLRFFLLLPAPLPDRPVRSTLPWLVERGVQPGKERRKVKTVVRDMVNP